MACMEFKQVHSKHQIETLCTARQERGKKVKILECGHLKKKSASHTVPK